MDESSVRLAHLQLVHTLGGLALTFDTPLAVPRNLERPVRAGCGGQVSLLPALDARGQQLRFLSGHSPRPFLRGRTCESRPARTIDVIARAVVQACFEEPCARGSRPSTFDRRTPNM